MYIIYREIENRIENIWLQIKTVINSKLNESGKNEMDEQTEEALKNHILQIPRKDSPVRSLIGK